MEFGRKIWIFAGLILLVIPHFEAVNNRDDSTTNETMKLAESAASTTTLLRFLTLSAVARTLSLMTVTLSMAGW